MDYRVSLHLVIQASSEKEAVLRAMDIVRDKEFPLTFEVDPGHEPFTVEAYDNQGEIVLDVIQPSPLTDKEEAEEVLRGR